MASVGALAAATAATAKISRPKIENPKAPLSGVAARPGCVDGARASLRGLLRAQKAALRRESALAMTLWPTVRNGAGIGAPVGRRSPPQRLEI